MSNLVSTFNTEKTMQPSIDDWVKENLRYDSETGHFWWLKHSTSSKRRDINSPAGCNSDGYLKVDVCLFDYRSTVKLHRAAWFLFHGVWPKDQVDHINNVRDDNRIVNLREATSAENGGNQKVRESGSSKYKGVCWDKQVCKWRAQIMVNCKQIYLGCYHNEKEAALAYNKAALEYFREYAKINVVTP